VEQGLPEVGLKTKLEGIGVFVLRKRKFAVHTPRRNNATKSPSSGCMKEFDHYD
jgi:hypothetical protein